MSKLLKLLDTVPVSQAAKALSLSMAEEVTEADVLKLALDGHIKLSLSIPIGTNARRGKIVPFSETGLHDECLPIEEISLHQRFEAWVLPGRKQVLELSGEVSTVSGVWDLSMIGSEVLSVQDRYHKLVGGPRSSWIFTEGAFIQRGDEMCQLQMHVIQDLEGMPEWMKSPPPDPHGFIPAFELDCDVDMMLVVRTAELARFQSSLANDADTERSEASTIDPRSTTTYQNIIGALLELVRTPRAGRDSDAAVIDELIRNYGEKRGISRSTLELKFSEAKRSLRAS